MAKLNFGGVDEEVVTREEYPLEKSREFLKKQTIAVIGYGVQGPGQAMNFGKSKARFQMEAKTDIMFDDVAGIDEAKEELQEVVTFLKKPERFNAIGAKIPRGVLLIGQMINFLTIN